MAKKHRRPDLSAALAAVGELLFPMTGELPYLVADAVTAEEGARMLDSLAKVVGADLEGPPQPAVVLLHRGRSREVIAMVHGYEFLRLLKKAEYGE